MGLPRSVDARRGTYLALDGIGSGWRVPKENSENSSNRLAIEHTFDTVNSMELAEAVDAAAAVADALGEVVLDGCNGTVLRDELARLKRVQSKVDAQVGRLTHAADAAGAFIGTGARDTAEWLALQTGTSTRKNRTAADVGAAMAKSEELNDAVCSGRLSSDQAAAIVGAAGDLAVDETLLDEVAELPLNGVRPAVEAWRSRTDPECDADVASVQRARRYLRLSSHADGMTRLEGLLEPEAGAIVRATLDGIMNESHRDGTTRTRDQRCHDALVQLADAAAKGDLKGGRSNNKLLVTVPFETVVERAAERGHTHVGPTLDAATVRKLACDAGIHRVITGPASSILDFGHHTRLVPDNLFLALVARDGGCRWPGCSIRATWCDAHHIIEWTDHGPTDEDNCVLLCHRHHQLSHEPGWQVAGTGTELVIHHPDGATQVSKPPGACTDRAGQSGREPLTLDDPMTLSESLVGAGPVRRRG